MSHWSTRNIGISSASHHHQRFVRRDSAADEVQLDFKKEPKEIVGEILRGVALEGVTKGKRLAYLNAFVKYLQDGKETCYSVHDILLCLRVPLVHEATVIRLAALRVLRYLLLTEDALVAMQDTGVHYLIVRSLDIVLNNSSERLQALRLCQRILAISNGASYFPTCIARSLIAIGFDGHSDHDKLYRGSLSILCQLALLNPSLFIECGGVRVLLHNILGCTSPMVLEAMVGSLIHLLNVPETRNASGVNLQALVAPFTDVHFKHGANEPSDKDLDEREVGYQCAKTAIGAVLKSWGGVAHFCRSHDSGLQALVDALYIEQLEIRRTILDLICEIVGVKFPTWSDEVSVALSAVDPSAPQDSWKLSEGFIVQESLAVLPHLAATTPNITANHMALIVLSFLQRGLLEALVEVIVTGDTFISVRGTVLLGELLHLVDKYIPPHCYDPTHCIPTLIQYSATPDSNLRQQRAMEALNVLTSLQKIKSRPSTPSSLFLHAQLEYASHHPKKQGNFINKLGHVQVTRLLKRDIEANPAKLLKDTGVLNSKDSTTWQWDTILSLLKWAPGALKRVEDSNWHNFLKRIIDYLKPSSNLFSKVELGKGQWKIIANMATSFVSFLAEDVENFNGSVLLEVLLADIATQLDQVLQQPQNPFPCFLSPLKLETTLSQKYFLMVGKLTNTYKGFRVLQKGDILQRFLNIVCQVQHESYVKVIIASLSYREEYCKRILSAALSCEFENTRLYATQFLRILVRARLSGFSKWGIELLVNQLGDKNRAISLTALDILEEAIHDKMFLESLIAIKPTLSHMGDRGLLLLICFSSLPSGYKFLVESDFLKTELEKWNTSWNKRYVEVVEVLVRDAVSTLRRGDDGKYPERASKNEERRKLVDIFVPPHLYGQLTQHKDGLELLVESGSIDSLIAVVNGRKCSNMDETKELKAALWALAHFGTSIDAVPLLEESRVIEVMVELGRLCPVLSVRHTVFHSLCLLCVTVAGVEAVEKWEWFAMPRNHHESFTIWSPELFAAEETTRLLKRRVEEEMAEEDIQRDRDDGSDTCSAQLNEEDEESEELLLLGVEYGSEGTPKESGEELKASSLNTQQTASPLKWSHAHHRSHSDSHTLSLSHHLRRRANSRGGPGGPSGGARRRNTGSESGLSGRWRKDSVTESTTSGVSSCDSAMVRQTAELGHTTLSPIPSSASIATTAGEAQSPPSRGSSRATLPEPGTSAGGTGKWGSPHHRSLRVRKPIIRLPMLHDEEVHQTPYGGYPRQRSGSGSTGILRKLKTGSLDRHFVLSPGDLFESNKIMRVNSSLTSVSTPPSFRVRPESETKGPCYMGLCVPEDFDAIFLTDPSQPIRVLTNIADNNDEHEKLHLGDSFEYHTTSNCLGCYRLKENECKVEKEEVEKEMSSDESNAATQGNNDKDELVRKEALRFVSNLICSVGAKANEQGLLRLKQQYPAAFQDLCLYTELCEVMSKYNIRLALRRFLQEIFFDMPYAEFNQVVTAILLQDESSNKKGTEESAAAEAAGQAETQVTEVALTSTAPTTAIVEEKEE